MAQRRVARPALGMTAPVEGRDHLAQQGQETLPVGVVLVDHLAVITPRRHVIQRPSKLPSDSLCGNLDVLHDA